MTVIVMPVRNCARLDVLFRVDGWGVNAATMDQTVTAIIDRLQQRRSFLVCTLNLDHLVKLRADVAFRNCYSEAEIITADGFPVVLMGRLQGCRVERVPGADLIEPLCARAAANGIPVFLLGSTRNALEASARALRERRPRLDIRGTYAPSSRFLPESDEAKHSVELVRRSGARICFVALGAPKQEMFAVRAMRELDGVGFVCIGAGLDFIAGTQRRAPGIARRLRLEWLWRLMSNPRRLGWRYGKCALLFAHLIARSMLWRHT